MNKFTQTFQQVRNVDTTTLQRPCNAALYKRHVPAVLMFFVLLCCINQKTKAVMGEIVHYDDGPGRIQSDKNSRCEFCGWTRIHGDHT